MNQRSKEILGTLNGQNFGQHLLSGLWAPHINTCSNLFQSHTNAMGLF